MSKFTLVLTTLLLVLVLIPQGIMADTTGGNGEIDGSLVNGTAGGPAVGSLTVHLSIYQNDAFQDVITTNSTADGKFSFTQLPTDSTYSFVAAASYQQVQYATDLFSFDSGQQVKAIQLNVYETTTANVPVSVVMSHAIIDYASGTLQIMEYYFFTITGDRTYLGRTVDPASGRMETAKLSLPAGATGLQGDPNLPDYLTVNGSDLSYGGPLIPGTNQVIFAYSIPCNSDSYTLTWKVNYSTSRFDLLISNQDLRVSGPKLTKEQSLNINNNMYQDYSSQNLVPGDSLTAQLAGLLGKSSSFSLAWLLLLIPAAAIIVFLVLRRKNKALPVETDEEAASKPEAESPAERQRLLSEIAELDDMFEEGLIEEQEYRKLRAAKKLKILKMN